MSAKKNYRKIVTMLVFFLTACNLPSSPVAPSEAPAAVGPTASGAAPQTDANPSGGMQVRFVNVIDGGSINALFDEAGKPFIIIQFQVTGVVPLIVTLSANDILVPGEARNSSGSLPFAGEIKWYPMNGGGTYTLVVTALSDQKETAQTSVHITVGGAPAFTATPPPPDHAGAQKRFVELYKQLYNIDVPAPSLHRFDSAQHPDLSRWISAVYYKDDLHYIDLYDDGHYLESSLPYADPNHMSPSNAYTLCRPSGDYKVLVAFVDYGNVTINKDDAIAQVPIMANWMNQFYDNYAHSQGFKSAPMHISAQGVYLPVPTRGEVLTKAQVRTATGVEPAQFNFLIEIDIDANRTIGKTMGKGLENGGGVALQGCGVPHYGEINIWSELSAATDVEGVLIMDFNHELSHLFGMMDSWPFISATLPDGLAIDDWIPYDLFGWSDADGDGVPEIIEPTPYGTRGPIP